MSKIPLQTGKPTEAGLYAVVTTWEAAPEIRSYIMLRWTGTVFVYDIFPDREFPRVVIGWVGPIAEDLALEYDL